MHNELFTNDVTTSGNSSRLGSDQSTRYTTDDEINARSAWNLHAVDSLEEAELI